MKRKDMKMPPINIVLSLTILEIVRIIKTAIQLII